MMPRRGVLVRKSCVMWSRGIFAVLFPALLLLPALHRHPSATHEHGTHTAHQHAAVVHVDFLPSLVQDHSEHPGDHDGSDDASSHSPVQIGFSALHPRSLTLFLPTSERVLVVVSVDTSALSSPFAARAWLLARDHAPPLQTFAFSPRSPRSPPPPV